MIGKYGRCWRLALLLAASVFFSARAGAQSVVVQSEDGMKMLEITDSGTVAYTSNNGSLTAELAPDGFHVGDFTLAVEPGGDADHVVLRVNSAAGEVSALLPIDAEGQVNTEQLPPALAEALGDMATAPEGQLLLEANLYLLAAQKSTGGPLIGDPFDPTPVDSGIANCLQNLTNAIAGAAAAIAGCGTPACGTAYRWCCASGVSWYVSGLIGTASACRIATWR